MQNKSMTFMGAMREYFGIKTAQDAREAGYTLLTPADKAEYALMLREVGYTLTGIDAKGAINNCFRNFVACVALDVPGSSVVDNTL